MEKIVQAAIDQNQPGFMGGWIGSAALKMLLDARGFKLTHWQRRDLISRLGYYPHPTAKRTSPLPEEGNRRSTLYIRKGSGLDRVSDPLVEYLAAQGYGAFSHRVGKDSWAKPEFYVVRDGRWHGPYKTKQDCRREMNAKSGEIRQAVYNHSTDQKTYHGKSRRLRCVSTKTPIPQAAVQLVRNAIDRGDYGFRYGWIGSAALDILLTKFGFELTHWQRKALLAQLDYHPHPSGARSGRAPQEDNRRSTLYIHKDSGLADVSDPVEAYKQAQRFVNFWPL